jgi:hypothetical protein
VAVGEHGALLTSPTGAVWTQHSTGDSLNLRGALYRDGQFVVVGNGGLIQTSTNGGDWTAHASATVENLHELTFAQGLYVVVGGADTIVTSTNATDWTLRADSGGDDKLLGVAYGENRFVAVGGYTSGTAMTSADGLTWTVPFLAASAALHAVIYENGYFLAVGTRGQIAYSLDGTEWLEDNTGVNQPLSGVAYGHGRYVAVGEETIITSTDGVHWIPIPRLQWHFFEDVSFVNGAFVAVGDGGLVMSSVDGLNWERHVTPTDVNLRDITYGQGRFLIVGNNRVILESGLTTTPRLRLTAVPGTAQLILEAEVEAGRPYAIQSAEALGYWTDLFRFISTTPTVRFQQTSAGYESMQFYRAVAR